MKGLEGKLGFETSSVIHNLCDLKQEHPISAPKRLLLEVIMKILVLCSPHLWNDLCEKVFTLVTTHRQCLEQGLAPSLCSMRFW